MKAIVKKFLKELYIMFKVWSFNPWVWTFRLIREQDNFPVEPSVGLVFDMIL